MRVVEILSALAKRFAQLHDKAARMASLATNQSFQKEHLTPKNDFHTLPPHVNDKDRERDMDGTLTSA